MRKPVTRNHSSEWVTILCPSLPRWSFLLLFTFFSAAVFGNNFDDNDWNLSCDDLVQVSLDQNGEAEITPQMMLIGTYANYDNFEVEITTFSGSAVSNPVTCPFIGETLTAKVIDTNTGNACWGSLEVEDKLGAQMTCPTAPIVLVCDQDVDAFGPPSVIDNCDSNPDLILISEVVDDSDICGNGATITRTYVATDQYGNQSLPCDQVFHLTGGNGVDFPADVIWDCSDYNSFTNITNATQLTGNLSTTGSGMPSGVDGLYCPYNATHNDDTLSTCAGLKIIRTWVVLNWCNSTLVYGPDADGDDNEQVIKVLDSTPPVISQDPFTLQATITGNYGTQCASIDFVPPAMVTDECSEFSLRIFSSIGELDYSNGIDGEDGGTIPTPGLTIGTHLITYEATDACGNVSELIVPVEVVDDAPPIAVCDLITDVNLTNQGTAEVAAEVFDDGSNDNCCISHFEVKKMGQSDFFFAPSVIFNCEDDDEMVVVRIYDCFDNYNECMVEVEIQDKQNPVCIPPPPTSFDCTEYQNVLQDLEGNFGMATAADNCSAEIEELTFTGANNCGEGGITRKFRAFDEAGNEAFCQQLISMNPIHDWEIHFPENWYGECGDSVTAEEIIVNDFGCDLWAVNFSDQYFNATSDSVCFKLIRTWEVRNWCVYEQGDQPIVISTMDEGEWIDELSHNNYGYYAYQQIILLSDNTPPVIEIEGETTVCSFDDDCLSGIAKIDYTVSDECTDDVDEGSYSVDIDQDGTIDIFGQGEFEKNLPLGCHDVIFTASDGCGNVGELVVEVCVEDCKNPTPYCHEGLIIEIMQFGTIELWANDFDAGSFDNCEGDLIFSFSQDTSHTSELFTCWEDPIEQYFPVQIWVTDVHGNQAFCETPLLIQDNFDVCLLDDPLLEGLIQTENNTVVEDVTVELSGSGNIMTTTDSEGVYQFSGLTQGNDYSIVPSKNDDPVNGVSTFDLVLITRHILGSTPFETPYELIAADANNSETVTTIDLVEIRKLILTMIPNYTNNTSWRFVDAAYEFPNPTDPWASQFPEVLDFNNLSGNVPNADFVAVKIGDVSGNALSNGLLAVDDRNNLETLYFQMEDRFFEEGETLEIPFYLTGNDLINGFQFTLNFNNDNLGLVEISENDLLKNENFSTTRLSEGILTGSWHTGKGVSFSEKMVAFTLKMQTKTAGRLSDDFQITSDATTAEAYREVAGSFEMMNVDLQFGESEMTGLVLYQNKPNPFRETTIIGFDLPNSGKAIFSVFDTNGRLLKSVDEYYEKGYHQITLSQNELPVNGMLFYQLETAGEIVSKRMILVD